MDGKLDITSYGAGSAFLHGLKVVGWHVLSYAIILLIALISNHLHTLPTRYLDILGGVAGSAALINAVGAGIVRWLNSHAPADPPVVSPIDGVNAAGFSPLA